MSEIRNCRNFIQVHANIVIVAAKSEASIVITMVELFPEFSEVTKIKARLAEVENSNWHLPMPCVTSQESCKVSMNMLQDDGSH